MGVRISDAGPCLAASSQEVPCRSLVTDVAATRWIVSRRSLDSAEQGPESKQQSPGFLIPTATHIKAGWFSSHRSRPGPPLRPVPCFCRVLFGNIIHIALMYAF